MHVNRDIGVRLRTHSTIQHQTMPVTDLPVSARQTSITHLTNLRPGVLIQRLTTRRKELRYDAHGLARSHRSIIISRLNSHGNSHVSALITHAVNSQCRIGSVLIVHRHSSNRRIVARSNNCTITRTGHIHRTTQDARIQCNAGRRNRERTSRLVNRPTHVLWRNIPTSPAVIILKGDFHASSRAAVRTSICLRGHRLGHLGTVKVRKSRFLSVAVISQCATLRRHSSHDQPVRHNGLRNRGTRNTTSSNGVNRHVVGDTIGQASNSQRRAGVLVTSGDFQTIITSIIRPSRRAAGFQNDDRLGPSCFGDAVFHEGRGGVGPGQIGLSITSSNRSQVGNRANGQELGHNSHSLRGANGGVVRAFLNSYADGDVAAVLVDACNGQSGVRAIRVINRHSGDVGVAAGSNHLAVTGASDVNGAGHRFGNQGSARRRQRQATSSFINSPGDIFDAGGTIAPAVVVFQGNLHSIGSSAVSTRVGLRSNRLGHFRGVEVLQHRLLRRAIVSESSVLRRNSRHNNAVRSDRLGNCRTNRAVGSNGINSNSVAGAVSQPRHNQRVSNVQIARSNFLTVSRTCIVRATGHAACFEDHHSLRPGCLNNSILGHRSIRVGPCQFNLTITCRRSSQTSDRPNRHGAGCQRDLTRGVVGIHAGGSVGEELVVVGFAIGQAAVAKPSVLVAVASGKVTNDLTIAPVHRERPSLTDEQGAFPSSQGRACDSNVGGVSPLEVHSAGRFDGLKVGNSTERDSAASTTGAAATTDVKYLTCHTYITSSWSTSTAIFAAGASVAWKVILPSTVISSA